MNKTLYALFLLLPAFCSSEYSLTKNSGNDPSLTGQKKRVDVVSHAEGLVPCQQYGGLMNYQALENKFDTRYFVDIYKYVNNFDGDCPSLHKIIFYDYCLDPNIARLPKNKMICFKWEAIRINPKYYDFFYRVYTFDDDLVDGIKYFKFYYPVLRPMLKTSISFDKKSLCAMIATNFIPERLQILDFFSNKPKDSLHVYGRVPAQYSNLQMFKGGIPGHVSSKDKLKTLQKYKFCICFENTHTVPGYITEKIFDAFAAGCVPIYWGPQNVEKYIPAKCFIDYRKFKNNEEMYKYIQSVTKSEHESYIKNIRKFLKSGQAKLFSGSHFDELLYQAVSE